MTRFTENFQHRFSVFLRPNVFNGEHTFTRIDLGVCYLNLALLCCSTKPPPQEQNGNLEYIRLGGGACMSAVLVVSVFPSIVSVFSRPTDVKTSLLQSRFFYCRSIFTSVDRENTETMLKLANSVQAWTG